MNSNKILACFLEDDDFLDSNSSSSEEEIEAIKNALPHCLSNRHCVQNYFDVVNGYNEEEFIRHFRLSTDKFAVLAAEFALSPTYQKLIDNPSSRLSIDEKKGLLVFLWFAGHRSSYRDIADRFDLSLSSVHAVISRVLEFISSKAKDYIRLPTEEEMVATAQYFETNKGFPNIIGCIDGTHIKIEKPSERETDYLNRKSYYSMNVQAVCNEKKKFIDVYIGYPGSVHDARIFTNSSLYPKLPRLCENGRYILADSAYPLSRCVMVPYRDNGHLTAAQKRFNTKLSSCRIFIEHSFGMLKERFPQLYHIRLKGHERICHFIRACFCLHNFAREEDLEYLLNVDIPVEELPIEEYDAADMNGQALRNELSCIV